jgi:hypothetical protein
VLAIAFIAINLSRLQPLGMARAMQVTAIAQALATVAALVARSPEGVIFSLFVTGAWLASAALFSQAARVQALPEAGRQADQ